MKTLTKLPLSVAAVALAFNVFAAGSSVPLEDAKTDITDAASLQNGAKLFMNYCSGCHAISFMRYNRIGADLGLTDEDIKENLMFAGQKVGENIVTAMPEADAAAWFGGTPPVVPTGFVGFRAFLTFWVPFCGWVVEYAHGHE